MQSPNLSGRKTVVNDRFRKVWVTATLAAYFLANIVEDPGSDEQHSELQAPTLVGRLSCVNLFRVEQDHVPDGRNVCPPPALEDVGTAFDHSDRISGVEVWGECESEVLTVEAFYPVLVPGRPIFCILFFWSSRHAGSISLFKFRLFKAVAAPGHFCDVGLRSNAIEPHKTVFSNADLLPMGGRNRAQWCEGEPGSGPGFDFILFPVLFFFKSLDDHVAAEFWEVVDEEFAVAVVGFVEECAGGVAFGFLFEVFAFFVLGSECGF